MNGRSVPLAVTGATGYLGSRVARALHAAGVPVRLCSRSTDRLPDLPGADVVVTAYGDADRARAALSGVHTLFMVSAAESEDRLADHRTFVDAAASAGVQHVVYTSFLGAGPTATFTLARDHWATEEHIRASGMTHTFLRNSFYLDVFPLFAGDDGVIRGPAGNGVVGAVARDDVVRVATTVLANVDSHIDRTYDLTGPEALSLDRMAAVITDETGRDTTFHDESLDEAYRSRSSYDAPQWQLDAWVSTYTAIAAGELAAVTDSVDAITGRAPSTLAEFLQRRRRSEP